jgi:tetratricopeptide (TPR) repeat protein
MKKRVGMLIYMLAVLSFEVYFVWDGTAASYSPEVYDYFRKAQEAQNPEEQIENYEEAIEIEPDFMEAYISLGVAYMNINKIQEAISVFDEAHRRFPDNEMIKRNLVAAYINLGFSYYGSKRSVDEINAYQKALELDPQNKTVIRNLSSAYNNQGLELYNQGRMREACESLRKAMEVSPGEQTARANLQALFKGGCPPEVAASPSVKLETDMSTNMIRIGGFIPQKVVITAISQEQNLQYTWNIQGPGQLLKTERSYIQAYTPPDKIDKTTNQATITVSVTNVKGQQGKDTLTFHLIPFSIQEQLLRLKMKINIEKYDALKKQEQQNPKLNEQIIPILQDILNGFKEIETLKQTDIPQEFQAEILQSLQNEMAPYEKDLGERQASSNLSPEDSLKGLSMQTLQNRLQEQIEKYNILKAQGQQGLNADHELRVSIQDIIDLWMEIEKRYTSLPEKDQKILQLIETIKKARMKYTQELQTLSDKLSK